MNSEQRQAEHSQINGCNKYPFWVPRFWYGMCLLPWLSLLARNRFAVGPLQIPMALGITVAAICNSALARIQDVFFGQRVARAEIKEPPIIVIGHWRTGTTLMHELLALDERHTCPTTYECFSPNHFLLTDTLITRAFRFLVPSKRPMDNVRAGWERPQEDEFALCGMGIPSPYFTIAFPNRPAQFEQYVDLEGLSARAVEDWTRALLRFLKRVTVRDPRTIILKSPLHTCRIKILLELFPGARFVHLVRDPWAVFASTMKLWRLLYRIQGLQTPHYRNLEERVLGTCERMYEVFERQRALVDSARFCEVRFEDLVQDPVGQLRAVYEQLGIGGFERVIPPMRSYLTSNSAYRTSQYTLSSRARAEVARRWGWYARRYGYSAG